MMKLPVYDSRDSREVGGREVSIVLAVVVMLAKALQALERL